MATGCWFQSQKIPITPPQPRTTELADGLGGLPGIKIDLPITELSSSSIWKPTEKTNNKLFLLQVKQNFQERHPTITDYSEDHAWEQRERKRPSSVCSRLSLWVIIPKRDMGGPKMPLGLTSSEGTKNHTNILGSHTKWKMISLKFKFQLDCDLCIFAFPAPHMVPASKWESSNYLPSELIWVTNKFEASNKATVLVSCRHHWMWLAFNGPNLILVGNVLKERDDEHILVK